MVIDYGVAGHPAGEMLKKVAARMGWSTIEMAQLLDSELEVDHMLAYVTAVISKRMN